MIRWDCSAVSVFGAIAVFIIGAMTRRMASRAGSRASVILKTRLDREKQKWRRIRRLI
jgi:hypothetical protein